MAGGATAGADARFDGRVGISARGYVTLFGADVHRQSHPLTSEATVEAQQNTVNAAATCKAERSEGVPEFRAKYGKTANDRNAFGKCVSQLAKAPSA